jgi:hypothetical protein
LWNVIFKVRIISDWKKYFFVIPVFQYPETSLNYLENSLVQSDFGFINYIVINNVILMLYPLSKKCLFTLTVKNWFMNKHVLIFMQPFWKENDWFLIEVKYCHHLACVVVIVDDRKLFHFNLLLWNHWANWNQI